MECIGKFKDISRDWITNQYNITFSVDASVVNSIDSIKDCEKLSIKAVKYRKKRSLDAEF